MRILIDLRDSSAIVPAQAFAEAAAPFHEIWLLIAFINEAALSATRAAFDGLVAPERIRLCQLPPADTPWLQAAREVLHANLRASIGADTVYQPGGTREQAIATLSALEQAGPATAPPMPRPRMAFVSPLPPVRSGIADYSAELLPVLAEDYDLTIVVAQDTLDPAAVPSGVPVRDVAWFRAHGGEFDRILYHFGNSEAHQHMFALLMQHPGLVVLHDFYLANLLHHLRKVPGQENAFQEALFASHGYTALWQQTRLPVHELVWGYPCNKTVLDHATGVLVHSAFARGLAERWYGLQATAGWRVVPLLRAPAAMPERAKARAALGLGDSDILVCSFGMLGPTKLNAELLDAWRTSALGTDRECRLVFVGDNAQGRYGENMQAALADTANAELTGYVDMARYRDYLAACDIAVQMRASTRGETSAAILDCMLAGAATIVNAHGALAELPADTVHMLADEFTPAQLAYALESLRKDGAERARLGTAARTWTSAEHGPNTVRTAYHAAIEDLSEHSARSHYQRLLRSMATLGPARREELALAAEAIAANAPPLTPRQLLVDVSALVQTDLRTGIQRVVRAILMALIQRPPAGYRIEPVYQPRGGSPYHYAREWMARANGLAAPLLDDAPIDTCPGDVFLGIDLFMEGTAMNEGRLRAMGDKGVRIHFVVYDILPLQRPDCFPYGSEEDFRRWILAVARVAHGLSCISAAVADDLFRWLLPQGLKRNTPLEIGYFHLGADIEASLPTRELAPDAEAILARVRQRPSILMVGTVEPRKGHLQALSAFEQLWERGSDANLLIVGKQGWMVEKFAKRARKLIEAGAPLIWLDSASDAMLEQLYGACQGMLMASEGEGFGLPLVEAARHGLPILARDLPVFREVAGAHATYFDGDAKALAAALAAWLEQLGAGTAPDSRPIPQISWADSAQQLMESVLGGQVRHWLAPN